MARAAGLGHLQAFLEAGMAAFASVRGVRDFLGFIESNESATISGLFAPK